MEYILSRSFHEVNELLSSRRELIQRKRNYLLYEINFDKSFSILILPIVIWALYCRNGK